MSDQLYYIDVEVKPGQDCKMPANLQGAIVNCYTFANSSSLAEKKVREALSADKYVIVAINETYEIEIAEFQTAESVSTEKVSLLRNSGEVYYGEFHGWED